MYKSFKEAIGFDSKANSRAGFTLIEIQSNSTSLLNKQKAKCASFEVMFGLYEHHPSVKPVTPSEVGTNPDDVVDGQDAEMPLFSSGDSEATARAPIIFTHPAVEVLTASGKPVGVAARPLGKPAAVFNLKPGKETKKMELGEAYLAFQTAKMGILQQQFAAKTRTDILIALYSQGKSKEDVQEALALL